MMLVRKEMRLEKRAKKEGEIVDFKSREGKVAIIVHIGAAQASVRVVLVDCETKGINVFSSLAINQDIQISPTQI